jgi:hypothetical protein
MNWGWDLELRQYILLHLNIKKHSKFLFVSDEPLGTLNGRDADESG